MHCHLRPYGKNELILIACGIYYCFPFTVNNTNCSRIYICAGADIKELSTLNALQGVAKSERGQVLMFKIANMSKPVIVAINGFALGGG